jgi:hypothetical protein
MGDQLSLYQTQKLIYTLNRDPRAQERFRTDRTALLSEYDLTAEERGAIETPDIGLLYVLGVNGQLLMHLAALCGVAWADYIQAMRDGVARYGPVRAGVYAMTTRQDEKVAGV